MPSARLQRWYVFLDYCDNRVIGRPPKFLRNRADRVGKSVDQYLEWLESLNNPDWDKETDELIKDEYDEFDFK